MRKSVLDLKLKKRMKIARNSRNQKYLMELTRDSDDSVLSQLAFNVNAKADVLDKLLQPEVAEIVRIAACYNDNASKGALRGVINTTPKNTLLYSAAMIGLYGVDTISAIALMNPEDKEHLLRD